MTLFEEKVNAYRENKRLIEELEAMNDAVKAEIIDMMHGAPEMVQGTAKAITRMFLPSGLTASYSRRCTRMYTQSAAAKPPTSVLAWYKGVQAVILSALLFFFWFFSALFKASK